VPRRNRKGRRSGQRPRKQAGRYHSNRESRRERRELAVLDQQPKPAVAAECGNCLEWLPPKANVMGGKGTCNHPASGVLAPSSDTAACQFFNTRL